MRFCTSFQRTCVSATWCIWRGWLIFEQQHFGTINSDKKHITIKCSYLRKVRPMIAWFFPLLSENLQLHKSAFYNKLLFLRVTTQNTAAAGRRQCRACRVQASARPLSYKTAQWDWLPDRHARIKKINKNTTVTIRSQRIYQADIFSNSVNSVSPMISTN